MKTLLLQAGHSSLYPPFQPNGGGAPGEAQWTGELGKRVAARLSTRGVAVTLVGHWYGGTPPPGVNRPFDLALSLHYDAPAKRGDGSWDASGCFADRSPDDPVGDQADRFIALWQRLYPAATGIGLDVYRGVNNPNTDRYYMWAALHPSTPAVIVEHGCGSLVAVPPYPAGDDAAYLHGHLDDVADTDAAAILAYFGILEDDMTPAQREVLSILAERQLDNPQALRDLYTYSDQREVDVTNLRAEVAALKAQQGTPAVVKVLTPPNVTVDVQPAA